MEELRCVQLCTAACVSLCRKGRAAFPVCKQCTGAPFEQQGCMIRQIWLVVTAQQRHSASHTPAGEELEYCSSVPTSMRNIDNMSYDTSPLCLFGCSGLLQKGESCMSSREKKSLEHVALHVRKQLTSPTEV